MQGNNNIINELLTEIHLYKNEDNYFKTYSIPSMKIDENSWIYKVKKRLEDYIN